jgi:hypothetical protein
VAFGADDALQIAAGVAEGNADCGEVMQPAAWRFALVIRPPG